MQTKDPLSNRLKKFSFKSKSNIESRLSFAISTRPTSKTKSSPAKSSSTNNKSHNTKNTFIFFLENLYMMKRMNMKKVLHKIVVEQAWEI